MSDQLPAEHTGTLGRLMPCDRCQHDAHILRCEALIYDTALCPCRDVPVPGVYVPAA